MQSTRMTLLGIALFALALNIALGIRGLKVGDRPAGDGIENAWITTKVKLPNMTDSQVLASDLNVDTRDDAVTFLGTVATRCHG